MELEPEPEILKMGGSGNPGGGVIIFFEVQYLEMKWVNFKIV